MEFQLGQCLIISQKGKFFDKARIDWVEETGNGRILHVVSTVRDKNKKYKIGEVKDETWQVLFTDPPQSELLCYDSRLSILTLEIA